MPKGVGFNIETRRNLTLCESLDVVDLLADEAQRTSNE
jgi:hypothetical protein